MRVNHHYIIETLRKTVSIAKFLLIVLCEHFSNYVNDVEAFLDVAFSCIVWAVLVYILVIWRCNVFLPLSVEVSD